MKQKVIFQIFLILVLGFMTTSVYAQESKITSDIVKEQVKCVFENSNEIQKCYTNEGIGCSGTGTCIADVKGKKGDKQIWKSSCGGEAYTIIDGDNDYAEFKCPKTLKPPIVTEQVKCVFENSDEIQKCYTNDGIGCSGTGTCIADVKGKKGDKQIWKSSCGGYAYTIIDGDDDYAEFKCILELKVTEEIIGGKGFRYAYWQCYDKEEEKQGGEASCKLSRTWKKYATEFCQEKCNEDNSKCGVTSFSIIEECYLDLGEKEVVFASSIEEEKKQGKKIIEEILICKDSCPFDGKCYPFGHRKSEKFCSDTGFFIEQLKGDAVCENNFECSSNLCVDSQCISQGLFKKIMNWLSKLFG